MSADTEIGGGSGVLAVVSGGVPASIPCGRAVEIVPVALVIVSVAGTTAEVERRARDVALALVFAVVGVPFLCRLMPWPLMSPGDF